MSKPENFTEDPEEVTRRIQHLRDYHGFNIDECAECGSEDMTCPNCHGDLVITIENPGKCDQPDCPINPIVPQEMAKRNN